MIAAAAALGVSHNFVHVLRVLWIILVRCGARTWQEVTQSRRERESSTQLVHGEKYWQRKEQQQQRRTPLHGFLTIGESSPCGTFNIDGAMTSGFRFINIAIRLEFFQCTVC